MAVPYGGLGYSSYFLALLYFCLSVFASAKFHRLSTRISAWSTTKFFLLSLVFQTILRALAFITMVIIKAENVDTTSGGIFDECAQPSAGAFDRTVVWFNRVLFVLTVLPDFMFVSSYILLALVWAELFQAARRHLFSAVAFRKSWTIAYLTMNAVLYLTQVVLYTLLFVSPTDNCGFATTIKFVVYYTIAGMNFFVPLLVLAFRIFYSLRFAGFPYRSKSHQTRLDEMTGLVTFWGFGRLAWAVLAIVQTQTPFLRLVDSSEANSASLNELIYTVVTGTSFIVCELLPITLFLASDVLQYLDLAEFDGSGTEQQHQGSGWGHSRNSSRGATTASSGDAIASAAAESAAAVIGGGGGGGGGVDGGAAGAKGRGSPNGARHRHTREQHRLGSGDDR